MMTDEHGAAVERREWRARPVILAGIGLAAALAVQQLLQQMPGSSQPVSMPRIALATGIATAAIALGFGMERARWLWAVAFAAVLGAVAGMVFYWNGEPGWGMFGEWRCASMLLAIAIAVPLFQVARDEGGWRFPYADVHGHAWTDVVLWFACWGFVLIVFALVWLLSALFDLIGLHLLRELLRDDWFNAALAGAGFGGALGVFRERDNVVRLLQRVVTAVLAVLAPVLGVGLIVFLVALPFTGLGALWEATKSTTPILLSCVVGALILANAVIGSGEDEEAANPLLTVGAMALALAMLPLAIIAGIATGLRIDQYGFTPDRLWALVFVILACGYGVAYLVAVLRGRMAWARFARPANLTLAFAVCAIALFLATPLLSFNAISTADQVARLESGRIKPDRFDWAALGFDFGEPGKVALKRLVHSKNTLIAMRARQAATPESRSEVAAVSEDVANAAKLAKRLRILPVATAIPEALGKLLDDWNACGTDQTDACILLYSANSSEAIAVRSKCIDELIAEKTGAKPARDSVLVSSCGRAIYRLAGGEWVQLRDGTHTPFDAEQRAALKHGFVADKVEVRSVPSRRLFVGGVPVGDPFE